MSVSSIVRTDYLPEVRRLTAQVRVTGSTARGTAVGGHGGSRSVTIAVRALPSSVGAFNLISFTDDDGDLATNSLAGDTGQSALQSELDSTRETLQATIEELETSNEELQAMNEEMMASTEELQASNEELETINEELQASNEELGTLNEELQVRTKELADANLDLRNIQGAISQALILVDTDRRVTRYSPMAVRLFALVPEDVGVPLERIATTIPIPDLAAVLDKVLDSGSPESLSISRNEVDYQVYVSAWRNDDGQIGGGVLSINDVTATRRRQQQAILDGEELGIISSEMGIAGWTRRRSDGALLSAGEQISKLLGEPPQGLITEPETWFTNVMPADLSQARLAVTPDRPVRLQYRTVVNGQVRVLEDSLHGASGDDPTKVMGTLRDVTLQDREWRAAANATALSEAIFTIPDQLILLVDPEGHVLRSSMMAETYLGLPPNRLAGRSLAEFCLSRQRSALRRWLSTTGTDSDPTFDLELDDEDGKTRRLNVTRTAVETDREEKNHLMVLRDTTDLDREFEDLKRRSSLDSLTHLLTRSAMLAHLESEVRNGRNSADRFALISIDLDGFKDINDRGGHTIGDAALKEIAQRMRSATRETDTLARLGGDEFLLLAPHFEDHEDLEQISERLLGALRGLLSLGSISARVTASMGIAIYPEDGRTVESLLKAADTAMYVAKHNGGDRVQFHDARMEKKAETGARARQALAEAIQHETFVMYYQPILDVRDNSLWAAEALVRQQGTDGTIIEASEFIDTAEQSGLIRPLGRLVWKLIRQDLQSSLWKDIPLAVNLSPAELDDPSLIRFIQQGEYLNHLPNLILEVTEHVLLRPKGVGSQTLSMLRAMGARVAIDDFGTGFSNMSALQHLRPNILKIDASFTRQAPADRQGVAFLESAKLLSQATGCLTLAEGVESEEQLDLVRELGIELAQGYNIGRPMPLADFQNLHLADTRHPGPMP